MKFDEFIALCVPKHKIRFHRLFLSKLRSVTKNKVNQGLLKVNGVSGVGMVSKGPVSGAGERLDTKCNGLTKCSQQSHHQSKCSPAVASPQTVTGQQPVNVPQHQQPPAKRSNKDYIFGKVIGEGSFSTVYLTKDIHTNKQYAIKVCDKRHIIKEKKTEYVKRERDVLNILSNAAVPFFVKLYCTFQDADRLYFVLSYAKNGELLAYINKAGAFSMDCTRFYAAEILLALQHLHKLNIIHRDLKPENILLDENMHILITDFGTSKIVGQEDLEEHEQVRRNSFVGTAQYIPPELLTEKTASPISDIWALGCILYQMVSGLPPFRSKSEYMIFQKILKLEYDFPEGFCPIAEDLVKKLLVVDPKERLGAQDRDGYQSIRRHQLFDGIDWDSLPTSKPPAILPFVPGSNACTGYRVPDHLEPGLDDKQLTRLLGLDLLDQSNQVKPKRNLADVSPDRLASRLSHQQQNNFRYHTLVEGNLILKQGLVDKRKGLFARRRMLLLTQGPHLYYVDPVAMVLKGEIPWSSQLRAEPKNFKIFFLHTPNRTYYLEDPEGFALEWCRTIEEVKTYYYSSQS